MEKSECPGARGQWRVNVLGLTRLQFPSKYYSRLVSLEELAADNVTRFRLAVYGTGFPAPLVRATAIPRRNFQREGFSVSRVPDVTEVPDHAHRMHAIFFFAFGFRDISIGARRARCTRGFQDVGDR